MRHAALGDVLSASRLVTGISGGGDAPRTGSVSSIMGDPGGSSPAGAERAPLPEADGAPKPDDSAPPVSYEDRPGGMKKSEAGD